METVLCDLCLDDHECDAESPDGFNFKLPVEVARQAARADASLRRVRVVAGAVGLAREREYRNSVNGTFDPTRPR